MSDSMEVRDREKVMPALKKSDTQILGDYQIYHNFVRPPESLNGQTPSERSGIGIEGKDKWLELLETRWKTRRIEIA